MRKSKIALFLGIFLSVFIIIGCSNPASDAGGGGNTNNGNNPNNNTNNGTVTVNFYYYGDTTPAKTVEIKSGTTLSYSQRPTAPYISYNRFMYWSESTASVKTAVEYDFTKPITKNTSLYATYCPRLNTNAIQQLKSTFIEIQLMDPNVCPLDDGSYAGIKFQHSTNNKDWEDMDLSIPSSKRDNSSYRYLTYTFPEPLPGGLHYIKVTNKPYGDDTYTESVTALFNPRTITFNDCGTILKTIELEAGEVIPDSDKPSKPSKTYNYFMHWSTSKASVEEAVEYDFSKPVNDNIVLYSIYKPKLSSIKTVTPSQIEIILFDTNVFPLENGSYAGLQFKYRAENASEFQVLNVDSIPADSRDEDSFRYLTYSYANNENLQEGTYKFQVTNGEQDLSKDFTVTTPKAASNLNAEVADSYAKISFKTEAAGWSYKVAAYNNDTELAYKKIAIPDKDSTGSVEFFGLENGTEYTFKVITDGTDKFDQIIATPSITKKTSDWLFVMYMDGDNNLNDPIYLDLNEAEKGLSELGNNGSVNIVALWDGWDFKTGNDDEESSLFNQAPSSYNIKTDATLLLELGADSNNLYASNGNIYWAGCKLASDTKNLTYTAPWIMGESNKVSTNQSGYKGEVNMGDAQTLTNYLKWIDAHYKVNKGIILQFSNHGGGPRSATINKPDFGRRSMCWDETSGGNTFLKTSDVSGSLKAAGFGSSKKVKMIMEDVCLGGSLEEAYELKDYAEYYIGSPNNIPGMGFDYIAFVQSLTSTATIEEIGSKLVKSYKNNYEWNSSKWSQFISNNGIDTTNVQPATLSLINPSLSTLSFIDLSKINAVKTAVSEYASVVSAATAKDEFVKYDSATGKYYIVGESDNIPSTAQFVSIKEAVKYWTAYYGEPIYYEGTFGCLKDIGFMTYFLNSNYSQTENVTWNTILTKSNNVKNALNDAIIACWRDGYNKPTYYKNLQDSANSGASQSYLGNANGLGLTINCSCWVPHAGSNGKEYLYEDFADWYKNDLAFGKDCSSWTSLIESWFSWQN